MEDLNEFKVTSKSFHQHPISFQLLVFLYRIGKEGSRGGSLEVRSFLGIGKGSVKNYVRRCVKALHEIKDKVVYWPDAHKRMEMRKRLLAYGFCH